jgi:hypothetical protein
MTPGHHSNFPSGRPVRPGQDRKKPNEITGRVSCGMRPGKVMSGGGCPTGQLETWGLLKGRADVRGKE